MKMGFYGHGGMGWIGMIIGLFITIGLIVGFVVLVVWAVRRLSGNSSHPHIRSEVVSPPGILRRSVMPKEKSAAKSIKIFLPI